jgi:hypothetical protein
MFDELKKYKTNNHFFFDGDKPFGEVCNAPKKGSGVYVVYALTKGKVKLIYIGSSEKMQKNGKMRHRIGGLYDRLVNGKQFEKPRRISWLEKLTEDQIDALDVYWYETINSATNDIPAYTEALLIQKHHETYGCLPDWNMEF